MNQQVTQRQPARERILDTAFTLCYAHGPRGIGIDTVVAESEAGTDAHDRTIAHKQLVRAWVTDLARRAAAAEPELLARQLTLLLDGGLAAGVLDADPAAPAAAKAAARALVDIACPAT